MSSPRPTEIRGETPDRQASGAPGWEPDHSVVKLVLKGWSLAFVDAHRQDACVTDRQGCQCHGQAGMPVSRTGRDACVTTTAALAARPDAVAGAISA